MHCEHCNTIVFFESVANSKYDQSVKLRGTRGVGMGERGGHHSRNKKEKGVRGHLSFYLEQKSHPNYPPLPQGTSGMSGDVFDYQDLGTGN